MSSRKKNIKARDLRRDATTITATNDPRMEIANRSISVTAQSSLRIFNAVILGPVSFALQRGWASQAIDPNFPYFAFVYATSILINAAKNGTPMTDQIPKWFSVLTKMVTPKTIPFYSGGVAYNWSLDFDASATQFTQALGPLSFRTWNIGVVSDTFINGGIPQIIAPTGYTDDLGLQAWTSLINFLSSLDTESEMHKLVSATETNKFSKDPSAFADSAIGVGGSAALNGGFLVRANLEVFVKTPQASVFVLKSSIIGPEVDRNTNHVSVHGGDGVFLGGTVIDPLTTMKTIGQIEYNVFKPIDFNELVDVVAQWVGYAQTAAGHDIQLTEELNVNDQYLQCPISFQELQLLLRAVVVSATQRTNFKTQGVYPEQAQNNFDNVFTPLVVGQGTYGRPVAMMLPVLVMENIRSLCARGNMQGGRKGALWYYPLWGVYSQDVLVAGNYTYTVTIDGTTQTNPSFITPSFKTGKKDKAGVDVMAPEVQINIVDGTASGNFYAINDPGHLDRLSMLWNNFLIKLRPFIDNCDTLGTDSGVGILAMTPLSAIVSELVQAKKTALHSVLDSRLCPTKALQDTIYTDRVVLANTFGYIPYQEPWEKIQSIWIAPQFMLVLSGNEDQVMTLQKASAYAKEPHTISYSPNDVGVSLASRHANYAEIMTHDRNGVTSNPSQLLEELEKQGKGGALSSLAAKALGPLVGDTGSAILNGIASFLPI